MCTTCGCGERDITAGLDLQRPLRRAGTPGGGYGIRRRPPPPSLPERVGEPRRVEIEQELLAKNDALARQNREALSARRLTAVNLLSSPGSGKTTLLERTIRDLSSATPIAVIEGDQETSLDSDRIRQAGAPVLQINTGRGCHLDAEMIGRALPALACPDGTTVFIENVGNLICPALFDLGEQAKVAVISVTEGEDKPLKYPHVIRASTLLLLNKIDLLPYVSFDLDRCTAHARRVHPGLEVLAISAWRGDGMDAWYAWLRRHTGACTPRERSGPGAA